MPNLRPLIERFQAKIDKSAKCWIFKGPASNQHGHRAFYCSPHHKDYAHRVAWKLANHRSIPKGKIIRHSCDTPACVRPDHLLLGTQRDNVYDMLKRRHFRGGGPGLPGESNPQAKLSTDDVVAILACHKTGRFGYRRLSRFFGVTPIAIKNIIIGKTWRQTLHIGNDGSIRAALVGRVMPTSRQTA